MDDEVGELPGGKSSVVPCPFNDALPAKDEADAVGDIYANVKAAE